jgi:indolepyruvate ferredoxin oxidoreductase, alpha subunit
MHELFLDEPEKKVLLLGNEGIVRGALEAGVEVTTAYPGTPSSEIADTFFALAKESDLYFEFSTNEKVALEVAAGAAIAGMRALCSMKHVGLNVAADPLNTLSYTGVRGGMVIVTADDPSMHSSQNEQDNRFYAKLSLLPMLEPSSPAEAMELTRLAFDLSERLELPVLLRTTTRVNHARGVCTLKPLLARRFKGRFERNPRRWVPVPGVAYGLKPVLLGKQEKARALLDELGVDRIEGAGGLGVVTSGVAYAYVKELLDELGRAGDVQILKIGAIHPTPRRLIEQIATRCERLLVVEELEPYLETEVRAVAQAIGARAEIFGKGDGWVPRMYELSPDRLRPAISRLLGLEAAPPPALEIPKLPPRPPLLCAGCTHRTTFYAVKSIAEPDTYFSGDIGCYTLGLAPPLSTIDAFICMGSSVTLASGVSIRNAQKHIAFIGDSTFFHSGIAGLVNAVHNGHDLMLVILDNSTTAMTGHQPHPGNAAAHGVGASIDIESLVRSLGITEVHVVDPENLKRTMSVLDRLYHGCGVRVVISRHPCPLYSSRILKEKKSPRTYRVDPDRCKTCGKTKGHEPCGVPILKDDELLRARVKIATADLASDLFPGKGASCKQEAAPCVVTCPANVCAFGYLSAARAGRYEEALALIRDQVPLPLALGRVCHHPCEARCVRGDYDEPIAINGVKRFLAERETDAERAAYFAAVRDKALEAREGKGARVAVVGAGPAGIAAAFDLNLRGYDVTLFDREKAPGGLLATGIPAYRMPRDLLKKELDGVLASGIRFAGGQALGRDLSLSGLLGDGFAAVCLATGAHRSRRLAVSGEDATGVESALGFLRRVYADGDIRAGSKVMVVGGGDAAIDAARTARRLGAEDVVIAYRRSAQEMPASREEVEAALAEGVRIDHQTIPVALLVEGGAVVAARCARTELGEKDRGGRRRPVIVAGSERAAEVDHVIVAVGQELDGAMLEGDLELARTKDGFVVVDPTTGATSDPRVFAAGDATGGAWTVIAAIAEGKKAAYGIDAALAGGAEVRRLDIRTLAELADAVRYHPPAVVAGKRPGIPERDPEDRLGDFAEIASGLTALDVSREAERCLSCGRCARCNNCIDNFGCPAIYKKDGRVFIDEVLCIGCGVCAQVCPNDAIVQVGGAGAAR